MKVGIIDYGSGNLGSVVNSLLYLKVTPVLLGKAVELNSVDCLILPGVGNFSNCARLLELGGWVLPLRDQILSARRNLLGICVGMQLLADCSYEGATNDCKVKGLGIIPGEVKHLHDLGCNRRIPHVGWNEVATTKKNDDLFRNIPNNTDFYFVHSYAFSPKNSDNILAYTHHDVKIAAVVRSGNAWGAQFHPEKSSRAGFQFLKNFIELAC